MKTALITGTNRGLGLEFVKQYLNSGWNVIACCRKPDDAKELNQLKFDFTEELDIYGLDVSNLSAITNFADCLRITPIDLLISNAGMYGSQLNSFGNVDYENWIETFKVNTMAGLKIAESFVDHIACSTDKKLIFVTSQMGSIDDNGSGGSYIYRSTKCALNAVVKSLSVDLRSRNITVSTIHPGWVLTDMGGPNALISVEESVSEMKRTIDELSIEVSGNFLNYDGNTILW
ncbi:MAG TPA: SDR family oxidoreductase [Victivallales bacterium]|nr:SDR family oxidoreductase [Victivallales bacterium]